ncbi:hypothetical protein ACVWW1_007461 [Bradyrhizobium sp. JR3.5]
MNRRVARWQIHQCGRQIRLVRQCLALDPIRRGRKSSHSLHCSPLAFRDYAEEIAIPHDLDDPGHPLDPRDVAVPQRGAITRRANDTTVQHPFGAQIVDVRHSTSHLGRNIDPWNGPAHHGEVCRRGQARSLTGVDRQQLIANQFTVAEPLAIGPEHLAIAHLQRSGGHAESAGRLVAE